MYRNSCYNKSVYITSLWCFVLLCCENNFIVIIIHLIYNHRSCRCCNLCSLVPVCRPVCCSAHLFLSLRCLCVPYTPLHIHVIVLLCLLHNAYSRNIGTVVSCQALEGFDVSVSVFQLVSSPALLAISLSRQTFKL